LIYWFLLLWKGIRILERELKEFTERGGKKSTYNYYIGAQMPKVESFSSLENTEVKVSIIQATKDYMRKRICFKETLVSYSVYRFFEFFASLL
jgi:hypothetical protein